MQNIAEGSMAAVTSKKTEIKLTGVARASLEELLLDYEDYLRQHHMICLINQACFLLSRQVKRLEEAFLKNGGYTEWLYRERQTRRGV